MSGSVPSRDRQHNRVRDQPPPMSHQVQWPFEVVVRHQALPILVIFASLTLFRCATPFPEFSQTGRISEVKIGDPLFPSMITVRRGDEIRWVNTAKDPARIFFSDILDGRISCRKGFMDTGWDYIFGDSVSDFFVVAKIGSNDFASLCFSTPGVYAYSILVDKKEPGEAMKTTGVVTIE